MEGMVMLPSAAFWSGKDVLVTGHTGFKGAWLSFWLRRLGANVAGIALRPKTEPNLYSLIEDAMAMESHLCDINDSASIARLLNQIRPQIIFHLAAQSLVRPSYIDPLLTWKSNVMGTAHILDGMREVDTVRVAVMITTDKVYRNQEWPYPYRENDILGGHDPYSASKAACEILIDSYRNAYLADRQVAVASARAGNVIGGGDWSDDRLVPDAVRSWLNGKPLQIRRPDSIRPWQHVLDPLGGYMLLAERLWKDAGLSGAYNFGPESHQAVTVRQVVEMARAGQADWMVEYDERPSGPHEAGRLSLEIARARGLLGFSPRWALDEAIQRTMEWYRGLHSGLKAHLLCKRDIDLFERAVT